MTRHYYVYIMTNKHNTALYTGVTNDLVRRAYEHKSGFGSGFTSRYNITKLVYYEIFSDAYSAIAREKQIKAGSRQKKIDLINMRNCKFNPEKETASAYGLAVTRFVIARGIAPKQSPGWQRGDGFACGSP